MNLKNTVIGIVILFIIFYGLFSFLSFVAYEEKQTRLYKQNQMDNVLKSGKELEQHKFLLKETKVDSLISGNMKGSFLLIGGSIYGEVGENKYLTVVYFDNDKIIDNTTDVYRITKFDLKTIEIVTIPKNETPYYKFIENSYQFCIWEDSDCDYLNTDYKLKVGKPRLFLSEGWAILNN